MNDPFCVSQIICSRCTRCTFGVMLTSVSEIDVNRDVKVAPTKHFDFEWRRLNREKDNQNRIPLRVAFSGK